MRRCAAALGEKITLESTEEAAYGTREAAFQER